MNDVIVNDGQRASARNPEADSLFAFLLSAAATRKMNCPYCGTPIPETWEILKIETNGQGRPLRRPDDHIVIQTKPEDSANDRLVEISLKWIQCFNSDCRQPLVHIVRSEGLLHEDSGLAQYDQWFAVPRRPAPRHVDLLVPDALRRDYIEAAMALENSPRLSAVFARKILADLLETYGGVKRSQKLSLMIAEFKKGAHPSRIIDNLDHLREIGDFVAHTQKDEFGNIVDVEPAEAEWTLIVLDTLLDYFIVGPEKDKQRRAKFDEKIKQAQRKPLK